MAQTNDGKGTQRAQEFLELIERGRRGKLKVYIGSSAGVGKTYRMLEEAHALRAKGVDVVLAFVETHGRRDTQQLIRDLETVPRRQIAYRGVTLEELDLEGVFARAPAVAVVDELAHTNAPGSTHEKRFQDVLAMMRAGINVLSAVNIQHLESLNDLVARMTGIPIRETVPDSFLAEADQVVNIDLSVEDLRERLQAGKIYPPEKIPAALDNFFTESNLAGLRELALREVAESAQREARGRETALPERARVKPASVATGRLMLALSSGATNGRELIRKGSRIAGRLNTHWYAVHVARPGEDPSQLEAPTLRRLADAFELAKELGAEVVRLQGTDIAEVLLGFARENGVERILLGRSQRSRFRQRWFGSLVSRVIDQAEGLDVQVLSTTPRPGEANK